MRTTSIVRIIGTALVLTYPPLIRTASADQIVFQDRVAFTLALQSNPPSSQLWKDGTHIRPERSSPMVRR
jgi:hypothetical protein